MSPRDPAEYIQKLTAVLEVTKAYRSIIHLDVPGYSGEGSLQELSWEEWFEKFDDADLALLVQDRTEAGERSNFNKLVSRSSLQDN